MNKKCQELKFDQDDIFAIMANLLGALAAPVRIKLIHYLSQAPLTVEVLSEKIDQSVANTSMHLRKMLSENVVSVKTMGQKRLYSLHPAMCDFWEECQDFVQQVNPKIDMTLEEMFSEVNWKFSIDETKNMLRKGEIIFLDVRPKDEVVEVPLMLQNSYINIPANDLMNEIFQLPKKKKILVLCRGRMCALSAHAIEILRNSKFKAYRFDKSIFVLNKLLHT